MVESVIIALITGLTGTFGVEVIRAMVTSKTKDSDTKIAVDQNAREELDHFRKELLERVNSLENRLGRTERELSDWRDKYYRLLGEHNDLQSNYKNVQAKYEEVVRELQVLRARP